MAEHNNLSSEDVEASVRAVLDRPEAEALRRYLKGIVMGDAYDPTDQFVPTSVAHKEGQRFICKELLRMGKLLVE